MQHNNFKKDLDMLAEAYSNIYGPEQIDLGDGWKLEIDDVLEDERSYNSYTLLSPTGKAYAVQSSRLEEPEMAFERAKQMKEKLMSA